MNFGGIFPGTARQIIVWYDAGSVEQVGDKEKHTPSRLSSSCVKEAI